MSEYANLPEVTELIRYVLYSDYVELREDMKEVPLSAIIVAPVESGKTATVSQFKENDGILYLTDATAWGIQYRFRSQLASGQIKRLLIPDLINPVNRKKSTVDSTITFFNSYISWEGVDKVATYATKSMVLLDKPLKGSLLTTMAERDFRRMVKSLAAIGFLSRVLLIGYSYDADTIDAILDDIAHNRSTWGKIMLDFPTEPQAVGLSDELADKLKGLARTLGGRSGVGGFRALNHLKVLAKSKALSEKRVEVTADDVHRIMYLADSYIGRVELDSRAKKLVKEGV